MSDTDNMVTFLMPDGSEVSNDPRFGLREALQKQLDSVEYSGDAGIPADEQEAQIQKMRLASIQSGQPGVGENATVEDPVLDAHGPLGSPAQQTQTEDLQKAKDAGATPQETSVPDAEPVDSNAAVLEAREAKAKAAEKLQQMQQKLADKDQEEGDPNTPFADWSGAQLQLEVAKRNAEEDRSPEDMIELKSGMKIADVAEILDADNARKAASSQS